MVNKVLCECRRKTTICDRIRSNSVLKCTTVIIS